MNEIVYVVQNGERTAVLGVYADRDKAGKSVGIIGARAVWPDDLDMGYVLGPNSTPVAWILPFEIR